MIMSSIGKNKNRASSYVWVLDTQHICLYCKYIPHIAQNTLILKYVQGTLILKCKKKKKASIAYLKFTFNWMSNIIVLKLVHYLENSMS